MLKGRSCSELETRSSLTTSEESHDRGQAKDATRLRICDVVSGPGSRGLVAVVLGHKLEMQLRCN